MKDKGAFSIIFAGISATAVLILTLSLLTGSRSMPEQTEQPPAYTLRSEDGRIAIYAGDTRRADYYLDTPVANLPEYDRILLAEGISVYSEEELNALIADLDG